MKCEICGAENPPSMNHTSMHTCICVDCCRDKKTEWQKRAEEAEVELAEARAEVDHWKSECNTVQRMVHEARAEAEQMQTAFKEILKIQRTVDLNLFDIEQVHSIAEAALSAAERRRWEGNE